MTLSKLLRQLWLGGVVLEQLRQCGGNTTTVTDHELAGPAKDFGALEHLAEQEWAQMEWKKAGAMEVSSSCYKAARLR